MVHCFGWNRRCFLFRLHFGHREFRYGSCFSEFEACNGRRDATEFFERGFWNAGFGRKNLIAEQIKEYIEDNYTDQSLSNRDIAEYFHMNISYLSTFFKENTGTNLVSYIHKVRLEKAKELLENTNLTLEEISQRVGCSSAQVISRLFKKYEGITPAAYRESRWRHCGDVPGGISGDGNK